MSCDRLPHSFTNPPTKDHHRAPGRSVTTRRASTYGLPKAEVRLDELGLLNLHLGILEEEGAAMGFSDNGVIPDYQEPSQMASPALSSESSCDTPSLFTSSSLFLPTPAAIVDSPTSIQFCRGSRPEGENPRHFARYSLCIPCRTSVEGSPTKDRRRSLTYRRSLPADFDSRTVPAFTVCRDDSAPQTRMLEASRRAIQSAVPKTRQGGPKPLLLPLRHNMHAAARDATGANSIGAASTLIIPPPPPKKDRLRRFVVHLFRIVAGRRKPETPTRPRLRPLSLATVPANFSCTQARATPERPSDNSAILELIRWLFTNVLRKTPAKINTKGNESS